MVEQKEKLRRTAENLFDELNNEFNFDSDICKDLNNKIRHEERTSLKSNVLKQDWTGTCWVNPPHGEEISDWVEKAYNESLKGNTIVCLISLRRSKELNFDYYIKGELRFIEGRVAGSSPFLNVIVIFGPLAQPGKFSVI